MDSLTNAERFLFAALKPDSFSYRVQETYVNVGLIGAILTDLAASEAISISDDKIVLSSSYRAAGDTVQDQVFKVFRKSQKTRKVKNWISRLNQRSNRYRKETLTMLKRKNLVRIEEKKFLFIPYFRAYVTNPRAQSQLIQDLRETLLNKETSSDLSPVLTLFNTCKMQNILARDKSDRKRIKEQLNGFAEESVVASGVGKVIKEMQAAVMVATTAAITTTTTAGR